MVKKTSLNLEADVDMLTEKFVSQSSRKFTFWYRKYRCMADTNYLYLVESDSQEKKTNNSEQLSEEFNLELTKQTVYLSNICIQLAQLKSENIPNPKKSSISAESGFTFIEILAVLDRIYAQTTPHHTAQQKTKCNMDGYIEYSYCFFIY